MRAPARVRGVLAAAVDRSVRLDAVAVGVAEGEHGQVVAGDLLSRGRHSMRVEPFFQGRERALIGQLEAKVVEAVAGRELECMEPAPPAEPDPAFGELL